jgi:predicted DNA-binding transcriptional regulator YafY
MDSVICGAIMRRQVIEFYYKGGQRLVEPWCLGYSNRNNQVLRAFQIGGYTKSGDPSGWRLYDLSKVESLVVTTQNFHPSRPDYNPNDSAMASIQCAV